MTENLLEDRRTLLVIAAMIVVLFAIANLPWQLDDYDQAKQAMQHYIELFPDDDFVRGLLRNVESAR